MSSLTDKLLGQREDVLHSFLGDDRATCGDAADERDVGGVL
jgi:hypothetical protein